MKLSSKLKGFIIFSVILLFFGKLIFAQESEDRGYIVKVGDIAPDFTVTTISGDEFTLSDHRGKVIMLQFTASWCGVCRKEMPHIENEIWQQHKDKDFVLLGLDRDEPQEIVKEFAKKMNVTYTMAPDPAAGVFSLYAVKEAGVTRNVIIDRNGRIVFLTRLYEEKEFNAMKEVINNLLLAPADELKKLSWLNGQWANISPESQFYETWEAVSDKEYSAFSFLMMNSDTAFSEKISLRIIDNDLFYIVNAGNQNNGEAVSFKLVSDAGGEFIFENPDHDFPQRIIYRHAPPDSLYARIEGLVEGKLRQEDFPMKRISKQ